MHLSNHLDSWNKILTVHIDVSPSASQFYATIVTQNWNVTLKSALKYAYDNLNEVYMQLEKRLGRVLQRFMELGDIDAAADVSVEINFCYLQTNFWTVVSCYKFNVIGC